MKEVVKEIQIMKEEKIDSEAGKDRRKWRWESIKSKILNKKESRYARAQKSYRFRKNKKFYI